MNNDTSTINTSDIFRQWTLEHESSVYKKINDSLLFDNYDILKENAVYINSLRRAITENLLQDSIKVYRNIELRPDFVQNEYKENQTFLWPTFTSTSRNKDVASTFGNYTFEIDASLNDYTYRTDIGSYSQYPYEQEILFYPYSGFRIKRIYTDARIIQLECVDTLDIESSSKTSIPSQIKLYDKDRQMFVYLSKDDENLYWCTVEEPEKLYIIADNTNGYWDSPHRYHHENGYFLYRGDSLWEEYKNHHYFASFQQI
ncbi:hypothetical protein I4U23_003597 [Adineta vaga]|nr:hypothetical protein I4U23_003597 [Adineta vaga]